MRLIDSEAFKDYILSVLEIPSCDLLDTILLELDRFPGIAVTMDKEFHIVVRGEL